MDKIKNENQTAIIKAVREQDEEFLNKSLSSKNVNKRYDITVTYTMRMYLSDDTEHSEPVEVIEKSTLLHLAARENLPVSAKILITKGADVNVSDAQGRTPLEVAVDHSEVETLSVQKVLIENKADVNFFISLWHDPLLYKYISDGQFELARLAIENGADVNMKGNSGSILECAQWHGTPEIVSMLKARGAKK